MHICEDAVKRLKTVSFLRKPNRNSRNTVTRYQTSCFLFKNISSCISSFVPPVFYWARFFCLHASFFFFKCISRGPLRLMATARQVQASSTVTESTHLDPVLTSPIVGGPFLMPLPLHGSLSQPEAISRHALPATINSSREQGGGKADTRSSPSSMLSFVCQGNTQVINSCVTDSVVEAKPERARLPSVSESLDRTVFLFPT